jgi:hypothetical protein
MPKAANEIKCNKSSQIKKLIWLWCNINIT